MVSGSSKKRKRADKKRQQLEAAETAAAAGVSPPKQQKHAESSKNTKPDDEHQLSLASRLKRHRGTADSTPLPSAWRQQHLFDSSKKKFLTPDDGTLFKSCQHECYRGFYWEAPDELPSELHDTFDASLQALDKAGLFLYDAVQAGGKKVSRTYVTRTLIGNPGSTYRYLGLRLFSHPWSNVTEDGDVSDETGIGSLVRLGYSRTAAKGLLQMGDLNRTLTQRTKQALKQEMEPHVENGLVGSANYTLTLVNKMEPSSDKQDLKPESLYGMGKTSVSWHKDSGLMDYSSIAVYHTLQGNSDAKVPWRVALRVASSDCPTPPLAVPLPSGSLYYLLDDLNHKHEHAVLAGSHQVRYSSTHRVAREGRGTWQYIRDKCIAVLKTSDATGKQRKQELVKKTRAQQQLLTEIEFEWLRQWHVQGKHHASLHPYWHDPMKKLMSWFQELEQESLETIRLLSQVLSETKKLHEKSSLVSEDLYDVMIESLEDRMKLRATWHERLKDPIYASMPEDTIPFPCPVLDRQTTNDLQLPENLKPLIKNLRKWRTKFVTQSNKKTTKNSDLTKKEKRKINSNWEVMKSSMTKQARKK